MEHVDKISLLYQRIGEFVVSFQWMEHKVREIGWFLLDPYRTQWPPLILREETNQVLLNKVCDMFTQAMDSIGTDFALARKTSFQELTQRLHALRKQRNNLLHSAYIELKGGDEVRDIYRVNPKIRQVDDEYIFDDEVLTEEMLDSLVTDAAYLGFAVSQHYTQLIHWASLLPAGRQQR